MGIDILTREMIEAREFEWLAPYAMKSAESMGRVHAEKEHAYRSVYQRDKERIIHSTSFRRLEYKTQVFVNHEGDYYRTRLTHTLEVAQISKAIAQVLRLNEELVEAIALAHDLGHTPFGHSGEDTLSLLMKEHGGFDHNSHGLRVVDELEQRYPSFPGLNLTSEVRRGIIRHSTPFDMQRMGDIDIPGPWLLEIQVVDAADEIAYNNHDLDDGLKSGLLKENDLGDSSLWREAFAAVGGEKEIPSSEIRRVQTIGKMIDLQISDLINNTVKNIDSLQLKKTEDIPADGSKIVCFSKEMEDSRACLKKLLMDRLYKHYRVVRMSGKASRFLKSLFEIYCDNPDQLPPGAKETIQVRGKHRAICDYIAGMTDRYALDQYKRLFEPYERV